MSVCIALWWVSLFIVGWAMVGYPVFLSVIQKVFHKEEIQKDYALEPTVTVMVVAHNEETVIENKLNNLIRMDYPQDKYNIIVTSDYSTDRTNEIVEGFISRHPDCSIRLHKAVNHFGKTNAQNEAQKKVDSEILIMTDANCVFKENAIRELVAYFCDEKIAYVCGSTVFTNADINSTAESEDIYWNYDSKSRDTESRFQTITAGDGNIYACRNDCYEDIPLIECHDSSFPIRFTLRGYRAVYNPQAISYEKSGENNQDEYRRKVRMNRNIFHNILPDIRILNIFKYKWFTVFYLGHRTCRYLLWLSHLLLLLTNMVLGINGGIIWKVVLLCQFVFYVAAAFGKNSKNKLLKMVNYYVITVLAQWHGVYNIFTGKAKSTWTKAESTR